MALPSQPAVDAYTRLGARRRAQTRQSPESRVRDARVQCHGHEHSTHNSTHLHGHALITSQCVDRIASLRCKGPRAVRGERSRPFHVPYRYMTRRKTIARHVYSWIINHTSKQRQRLTDSSLNEMQECIFHSCRVRNPSDWLAQGLPTLSRPAMTCLRSVSAFSRAS